MIQIRPNALHELQRLLNQQSLQRPLVRLDIASGGCFEWTYLLTFTDTYNQQQETTYSFDGLTLVMPHAAMPYLQNLTIDFASDLMGGGFRFINPQAQQTCGCGNSFSLSAAGETNAPQADCTQLDAQIHFASN